MWVTATVGKVFTAPVRLHAQKLAERMEALPEEDEIITIKEEIAARKQFTGSLVSLLSSKDPTSLLGPAYDDSGALMPNYSKHCVGKWIAYFRVDYVGRSALGVMVIHKDDDPLNSLATILDAIK